MNIIGGKLELQGDLIYDNGFTIRYRKLNDDEVKTLFDNIKLNTGFSLPEIMVQDFVQDGKIEPTFKNCVQFNKNDLHMMVNPLKKWVKHKKKLPKPKSIKKYKKKFKKTHIKK
jgi:hypothetical protein